MRQIEPQPKPGLPDVARARHLFFEEGVTPAGLVADTVWRSWQRCTEHGHRAGQPLVFNQVLRSDLHAALERNRQLIAAAEPAMLQLGQAMSGSGYGIILTDSSGMCVAAHGPIDTCGNAMRQALRAGVDLSERAVGTNAMWTAMAETRPIGIFGAEHFFAQTQTFQCVAAPIFGPDGALMGAIDLSREAPGPHWGALSIMLDCAAAIERQLLLQAPAHSVVSLQWQSGLGPQAHHALLAFGEDGEVLAMSSGARRVLGLHAHHGVQFRDLFLGSYGALVRALAGGQPELLTLRSGLRVHAHAVRAAAGGACAPAPAPSAAMLSAAQPPMQFGDPAIHQSLRQAMRALATGLPVLIGGETGTGKEVAARMLHAGSPAAAGPFVAINCGAIPRELIEGELFGYADGAYTGARRGGAKGRIEEADGGTLFLDEIGDMPLDLQTRLLRVLESREVTRLGESRPRKLAIQLLSATHQDMPTLVREQRFRSDLYYRLNGMSLVLPPLRERSGRAALIDTLLCEEGLAPERWSPQARRALHDYPWPGNVRELRTALKYARAMADQGECIALAHLPVCVAAAGMPPAEISAGIGDAAAGASAPAAPQNAGGDASGPSSSGGVCTRAAGSAAVMPPQPPHALPLKQLERDSIAAALQASGGNVTEAARRLGISRATLHRKLKRGLD